MSDNMNCSIKEQLLNSVEVVTESGCWIWMLTLNVGYGLINTKPKRMGAHRASYMEFVGEIPDGMFVCHRCDVPSCINPNHLFLGTPKDNMADMVKKGRSRGASREQRLGEKNPRAKLTNKDVLEIKSSKLKQRELCKKYNVSSGTISGIKTGRRWGHITQEKGNG